MRRNMLMIAGVAGVLAVIGGLAGFQRLATAGVVALMLVLFLLPWTEADEESG